MGTHFAMGSDIYGWSVVEGMEVSRGLREGKGFRCPFRSSHSHLGRPPFLAILYAYKKHQTGLLSNPREDLSAAFLVMF